MLERYSETLAFLVILLFLILAFAIAVNRRAKRLTRLLLSLFFVCLATSVLHVYWIQTGFYNINPGWAYFSDWTSLMYGPLLFLFTKSILYRDFEMDLRKWLHFLPALIFFLGRTIWYQSKTTDEQQHIIATQLEANDTSSKFIAFILLVYLIFYVALAYLEYRRYLIAYKDQFSSLEASSMGWLKHMFVGFGGLILLSLSLQVLQVLFDPSATTNYMALMGLAGMFVFVISSLIRGLRHSTAIIALPEPSADINSDDTKLTHYDAIVLERLDHTMTEKKPFLQATLSLADLASLAGTTTRDLSRLLNTCKRVSFYDYVNQYRVNHAKSLIQRNDHPPRTILEIMYASGFNSKSSFNTAFKKHTGETPSQFRNKINTQLNL